MYFEIDANQESIDILERQGLALSLAGVKTVFYTSGWEESRLRLAQLMGDHDAYGRLTSLYNLTAQVESARAILDMDTEEEQKAVLEILTKLRESGEVAKSLLRKELERSGSKALPE